MNAVRRILQFAAPYSVRVVFALLCHAAGAVLALFVPIVIGRAVDDIIGAGNVNFAGLGKTGALLLAAVVFAAVFQWIAALLTNDAAYKTAASLRKSAFARLSAAAQKYLDANTSGDLSARMTNDAEMVTDGLLQGIMQGFAGAVTIAGTLIFMLSINAYIALAVVALTPLSALTAAVIARRSHKHFTRSAAASGELSGFAAEVICSHEAVKAFGYEQKAQQRFDEVNGRLRESGTKSQFYSSLTNPATRFVNGIIFAAVGTFGALAAIKGVLTVGQLTSFLTYAGQYSKPFNDISAIATQLQSALAGARRLFEVLDAPGEPDAGTKTLAGCHGEITFQNVCFSYDKKSPLIRDFNLNVRAGDRIAIVGPTGSGKTTLINLLMRFYDVDSGKITVDGIGINDLTKESLRSHFGMVLQDTWLSAATVRENIAYAKPSATEEEVVAAAKAANAHSFIMRLPKGYDTVLNEEGGSISAGEKQLLCIARVMLADPPMLILDEATSNIDTLTEARIQNAFKKMMQGRTSFVVAHRLSTIHEADVIVVMKDGRIEEVGSHDELIAARRFYYALSGAV